MTATFYYLSSSIFVGFFAIIFASGSWSSGYLWTLLLCCLCLVFGGLGVVLGISTSLFSKRHYKPPSPNLEPKVANILLKKMMEFRQDFIPQPRRVVTSRNLDKTLQQLLDLICQDYLLSWYQTLAKDEERVLNIFQNDVWYALQEFSERLSKVDLAQFLSNDVMHALREHFKNIRVSNLKAVPGGKKVKFNLHSWLADDAKEVDFLRSVADIFCIHLLPQHYVKCHPVRHLLREILACTVFKNAVDLICDPDYINQKLFGWLSHREKLARDHQITYEYAATYEVFMEIINKEEDIEKLKQLRYKVITEIMQATTIQNWKREKGDDKDSIPKGKTKGELLLARNLPRYLNQLAVAKDHCEKRINLLGGPDYKSYTDDTRKKEHSSMPGNKVLSFAVVMQSANARNYFMKYLHKEDNEALLKFWTAVDSMAQSEQRYWHELAAEVYQMFITHSMSPLRNHLDRATIRHMEAFMKGDKNADAFFEAQKQIYNLLGEKYYPSFIVSDVYHSFVVATSNNEGNSSTESSQRKPRREQKSRKFSDKDEKNARISEHSTYAQQKLKLLDDKIINKSQALSALKYSQKPDEKMRKLQKDIEEEIQSLKTERRTLEFHIERTGVWLENVGKWKASICNAEVVSEDEKLLPYFVIMTHLPGLAHAMPDKISGHVQGWVITRKLEDFVALREKLVQIEPDLKDAPFPKRNKIKLKAEGKNEEILNKVNEELTGFLKTVLEDDKLAQSEAVFAFFSPSPEYLKQTTPVIKKEKFSFANLLKSLPGANKHDDSDSDDDELIFLDGGLNDKHLKKDSIAGPLYLLIGEVFEMHGVSNFLSKTLMVFVQVTFGRSINRQVRDTVEWLVSEPLLIFYLEQFIEAYWPGGKLVESLPPRTDDEKLQTRMMAKAIYLRNIPDALKNLVGDKNSRKGAIKTFESLQDIRLNKQIFYVLLELFLYEVFPELDDFKCNNMPTKTPNKPESGDGSQATNRMGYAFSFA